MDRYAYLKIWTVTIILLLLSVVSGYGGQEKGDIALHRETKKVSKGYLSIDELPDTKVIPPPPSSKSPGFALDEEINKKALKLQGTPRFELAKKDADLSFPNAADVFSCAVDAPITEKDTPVLYRLMQRILIDAGNLSDTAKKRHWRDRPFLVNKKPTCTPAYERAMRNSSSYPSGHTIAGWVWALILTEIAPDRADAIIARGRAFGESRIVCNVHWYSDVMEGFLLGAALAARLHAAPEFRSDLDAARLEMVNIRAKDTKPTKDCKKETDIIRYHAN